MGKNCSNTTNIKKMDCRDRTFYNIRDKASHLKY